jgi:hypothetical protein
MRITTAAVGVLMMVWVAPTPSAQRPADGAGRTLVGTWMLVSAEQMNGSSETPVRNPRGLLVFDAAGHALEIVTRSGRQPYAANQPTPAEALAAFSSYAGFWGSYRVDEPQRKITFRPEGAINPSLMGEDLTRSYERHDDRLTVTSMPGSPDGPGSTRWVWERVPSRETLSANDRRLVGFWQHVVERRVNATTGAVISETRRAPSIIVYTPAGYIGVHFAPLGRKRLAADTPTEDEARAALTGYVSYIAVYSLHPGMVVHHQLFAINPAQTTSFKRFFEISGDEINLKFPPVMNQGQQVRTIVTLKRLSGAAEMLGER